MPGRGGARLGAGRKPRSKCAQCGDPLSRRVYTANNRQKCCSEECRRERDRPNRPCSGCGVLTRSGRCIGCAHRRHDCSPRACAWCGEAFTPTTSRRRCCSEQCSHALTGQQMRDRIKQAGTSRLRTFVCVGCGKMETRRIHSRDAGKYCTRDCRFAHLRRMKIDRAERLEAERRAKRADSRCGRCGMPVAIRRRYCDGCLSILAERRTAERRHSARVAYFAAHGRTPPAQRTCWTCGGHIPTQDDARKRYFCSERCRKRGEDTKEFRMGVPVDLFPPGYVDTVVQLKTLRHEIAKATGAIR